MQAEQKLGWEEKVWKSIVLGVKRAAVRKAGCGQLSDPPVGEAGKGLPCLLMLGDLGLREQHSGLMAEDSLL